MRSLFTTTLFCLSALMATKSSAQQVQPPKVLIVIAHPDDETGFAATVYKITHEMKGVVDLLLVTNGEGGYKYSTLAESIYGLELTNEKVGRENLPRIRKTELMNAGKIIGIRNYFFLDQTDAHYGLDEREPLDTSWDVELVKKRMKQVMTKTKYDYIFCLIPDPGTHGGHKAATLLALRTVKELPAEQRPIVLGCTVSLKTDTVKNKFSQLKEYSESKLKTGVPPFQTDRTTKFGFKKSLDYKVIVNWEIAEHKSQGTMQLAMNMGDIENFWYFDLNALSDIEKTRQLFEALKVTSFPSKTY
jgi:LmbE family N-acetylglucosaminyl deacetylase